MELTSQRTTSKEVSFWRTIYQVIWPLAAPLNTDSTAHHRWWLITCAVNVIPVTAVIHHRVFQRPTCMLNNFGDDYTPTVVASWLLRDPSLAWAIIVMMAIYVIGKKWAVIQLLVAPLFISFIPLSLWIWDIPFSGRIICHSFHDNKAFIGNFLITSKHLYLAVATIYLAFVIYLALTSKLFKLRDSVATP